MGGAQNGNAFGINSPMRSHADSRLEARTAYRSGNIKQFAVAMTVALVQCGIEGIDLEFIASVHDHGCAAFTETEDLAVVGDGGGVELSIAA